METDFMNQLADDEAFEDLQRVVDSIMEIPDENLNDTTKEVISGMLRGAFTENIKRESVQELLKMFKNNNFSRQEAIQGVNLGKQQIASYIDGLKPSEPKRELLNDVFQVLYDMYDEALNRYYNYAFDLPIQLEPTAHAPVYAHESDACADIYASTDITIPAHSLSTIVPTGLRIALPEGWVAKIAPRSSIGAKTGLRLSNSIGIIDADYRGEIGVLYDNFSDSDYEIKTGDRIAQMWIERVQRFKPVVVDTLPTTDRGEGGFGSTGK